MSELDALRARLGRYPPDRYPVQHATTQFHLGVGLADDGDLGEAERALSIACRFFRPDQLPVEHAKAANALGAVRRMAGDLDAAADSFRTAAALFGEASLVLEQGAALYNLGLVHRELGGRAALAPLEQARSLLDPALVPGQAAAAARELGAALLDAERPDDAVPPLEAAVQLADRAGDRAGLGAAANILGLAHLAAGRPDEAVLALEQAVAAHPRSVRPEGYAMAKANLALAREAQGSPPRARLAALQALGAPSAPGPVLAQAADVLERVGAGPGALWAVLDEETPERWAAVVREEVVRWAGADGAARDAETRAWVTGQLARPETAADLAEAYFASLVELPPTAMDTLVRSTLGALRGADAASQEHFAAQCSRALARFPVPQWMRLGDALSAVSADLGLDAASW